MSLTHNTPLNQQPIGVFDSGMGGLTVLRALGQRLPHESFLYLGDTARLPYGTKSPNTVMRYARQCAEILYQRGIKMLVVACNTASAHGLTSLQEAFPTIPVIGVIEPGAQAACEASRNGKIVVIATEGTIAHGAYENTILRLRPTARVVSRSCSLFVALAEEGWLTGPITEAVARAYLEPLFDVSEDEYPADCLVLGCTHFPALYEAISQAVPRNVVVVDSTKTTAALVAHELERCRLTAPQGSTPSLRLFVTDAPSRFARVAQYFLDEEIAPASVELVELG